MRTSLLPGSAAPDLAVDLVGGGTFKLADATPEHFTMIDFHRGLHCPVCRSHTRALMRVQHDFAAIGVDVITVSMDTEERARTAVAEWGLGDLPVGYGLTEDSAREWGLYISTSIRDSEPARFSEPGLFLVRPDGTLFYAAITTMPFGRPDPKQMLSSITWLIDNDYPARGAA